MTIFQSETAKNTATACYLANKPLIKWIGNEGYQKRIEDGYLLEVEKKKPNLWSWRVTTPSGRKYEGYRPSAAPAKQQAVLAMTKDKDEN